MVGELDAVVASFTTLPMGVEAPVHSLNRRLIGPEQAWTLWKRGKSPTPTKNRTTIPGPTSPQPRHPTD